MSFKVKDKKSIWMPIIVILVTAFVDKGLAMCVNLLKLDLIPDMLAKEVVYAILVIFAVMYCKRMYMLKPGIKGFGVGMRVAWIQFLFSVWMSFSHISIINIGVSWVYVVMLVLTSLLIGFVEETLFRGIVLQGFLDAFGEESAVAIRTAVICSGLFFGVFHFMNLFNGASISYTLYQVVDAAAFGILMGAVFVRSHKNLWACMFVHAFKDGVLFVLGDYLAKGGPEESDGSDIPIIFEAIVAALYLICALFAMRKKKLQQVIDEETAANL